MMVLKSFRQPFKDAFAYWRKLIFREEFALDCFYEEVTDEKWKILTTHTSTSRHLKKSSSDVVDPVNEMILMQTNVLSQIPECFGLSTSDGPTKHRDKFKTSRPPKTQVYVNRRPTNEPLVRAKSDEDRIRQLREKNKKLKREHQSVDDNLPRRAPKTFVRFADQVESSSSFEDEKPSYTYQKTKSPLEDEKQSYTYQKTKSPIKDEESSFTYQKTKSPLEDEEPGYTYQKTKSKIRLKTKTKIKRNKWSTKSAPVLRRMNNVDEEMSSCTEFSQETNISFAAYIKKRTPNFNFKKAGSKSKGDKLKRSEGNGHINLLGFAGRNDNLQVASERNVTFNPIFQDEDSEKRKEKEMYELSRDDHVYGHIAMRDAHVDSNLTTRDNTDNNSSQIFGNHNNCVVQPRTVHVRLTDNIESTRYESHVDATGPDKNLKSKKLANELEDHVPVTCIDGPSLEEYNDDHVQVSNIDQSSFEEQDSEHVPITCIDDVGEQNDDRDSHVRRPTLIRAGRIHDLDMCGWYDDNNGLDYDKLFHDDDYTKDNDDDDFTTRMLKRTAAILTFDMTTRRRELYTIDEEPEE